MKNILKFGLMSAVTAVALAQTPTTNQSWEEDDVLAIASRGALSDSMQGFRKLADDEAGSIVGGVSYPIRFNYGVMDNAGTIQSYKAYYKVQLDWYEESKRRINIGSGYNPADYTNLKFIEYAQRNEYVYVEGSYLRNRGTSYRVVKLNESTGQVSSVNYLTDFTSRLVRHAIINTNFQSDRNRYFGRGW